MTIREDAILQVGPLNLVGPAMERDGRVKEDNDWVAVNVNDWMSDVRAREPQMEDADVQFFATLRERSSQAG